MTWYSASPRRSVTGTIAQIVAMSPPDGTWAAPTDVYGCNAQYSSAAGWSGYFGVFPTYALVLTLGLTNIAQGSTYDWNDGSGIYSHGVFQ